MATVAAHRALSLRPECVFETVKITGAADVDADGYTITTNPGNIVSTVAKASVGTITITLAQAWAGIEQVLVSADVDDFTFTVDSAVASTGVITVTCRKQSADASADTDPDGAVLRITLQLRLQ